MAEQENRFPLALLLADYFMHAVSYIHFLSFPLSCPSSCPLSPTHTPHTYTRTYTLEQKNNNNKQNAKAIFLSCVILFPAFTPQSSAGVESIRVAE